MNNKLLFTGGEPRMNENDFMRVQSANREFVQGMFEDYGECIVSGAACIAPGAGNNLVVTTDGFVYLHDEILKVDAGIYTCSGSNVYWHYVKSTTYESGGDKTYADGTPRQTWQKNRAIPTSVVSIPGGGLDCVNGQRYNVPLNDWTGVSFAANWIDQPAATPTEYKKDQFGVVWIRGAFKRSTAGSGTVTVFTLPAGFRPSDTEFVWIESSATITTGQMKDDGTFYIASSDFTSPCFFSLSFRTD